MTAISATALPLPLNLRGKVRDVYEAGDDHLLIVATDRVSAFDVVMAESVPHKGAVLTQLTAWWLRTLDPDIRHHLVSVDIADIVTRVPPLVGYEQELRGRAMLVWRTQPYPVECVMRGYLAGSAWQEYSRHGTLAGEPLAKGLLESDRLDPPLFSPATKAESGHDQNITIARMREMIGDSVTASLENLTHRIYEHGREIARPRGIIIADTKFEFGERDGEIILIDEVLTPDSSRFWPVEEYRPGSAPPSFDKQPLRDHLARERTAGRWDGEAPPPPLPTEVVEAMSTRYLEIFRRLTGEPLGASA